MSFVFKVAAGLRSATKKTNLWDTLFDAFAPGLMGATLDFPMNLFFLIRRENPIKYHFWKHHLRTRQRINHILYFYIKVLLKE